ncbi:PREDICTED: uncharacterized protein LOC104598219 [Nelumbo nucifera]|uniref:Uncharacterized protein LOC104598219 n=1 Tax=Nelumbo nucifera TaxID=4432 RepID=A0A1U7ZXE0_NELNU|nr:PREDICTED: uncharacterized protein LOC104598219 [Nelumbo nucifera]
MAHSITPVPAAAIPISTSAKNKTPLPFLGFQRNWSAHQGSTQDVQDRTIDRRVFLWGITGTVLSLNAGVQSASAAKRPPPPPPQEKKDPNVSGVQAKVLASIKRKEAMKEAMAKLRGKGKSINLQPSE